MNASCVVGHLLTKDTCKSLYVVINRTMWLRAEQSIILIGDIFSRAGQHGKKYDHNIFTYCSIFDNVAFLKSIPIKAWSNNWIEF